MYFDNEYTAMKLRRWETYLNNYRLPAWDDIPDFGLYMEQVIELLKTHLDYLPPELKDDEFITSSTINNYVRIKVMPEPIKKRYYRVHIAYLIIILTLKQSLSIAMIRSLLPKDLPPESVKKAYTMYAARHRATAEYFKKQVTLAAAPILGCEADSETAAENTEELIAGAAIAAGFSRLLAIKLLMLKDEQTGSAED